ncbi:MAG TPA: hypothetical protein VGS11_05160 [Candidatus Bathyarchaeia archaeon]|nr:hypothetical protein [Candidatus Bathyarchaeia archaeon]
MVEKKEEDKHSTRNTLITTSGGILAAALAFSGPPLISNLIITPDFQVAPSPDFSSVNVTNVGSAAHGVRITLVVPGNQTDFSRFSSENATWVKTFDLTGDQTVIVANLPRLGQQGRVSVKLSHSTTNLEVWVNSNERGDHQLITKGAPVSSQPDYSLLLFEIALFSGYGAFIVYRFRDSWIISSFRRRISRWRLKKRKSSTT